ncbi:MAG: tRNA (guanosine(46)-N7)-methyltransferase TrmB [Bacteroidetes bacterium]|nr:MAG: tRNA (guanosine(46)-N7)-methyltransferase TrmB [Bacteroidota bacterium]
MLTFVGQKLHFPMARKKQRKKDAFFTLPNTFDRKDKKAGSWQEAFARPQPLTLELGCGKAEFSLGMAARYPERNFLGIDLKPDRLHDAAQRALARGLENVAFLCLNLLELDQYFAENEAAEIWITFPDPFPKSRQAKHRMVNPPFLRQYRQVLAPEGTLYYKTDNLDLFHYSLEVFVREPGLHLQALSFDLHADEQVPDFARIETHYEQKFREMGTRINFAAMRFVAP